MHLYIKILSIDFSLAFDYALSNLFHLYFTYIDLKTNIMVNYVN